MKWPGASAALKADGSLGRLSFEYIRSPPVSFFVRVSPLSTKQVKGNWIDAGSTPVTGAIQCERTIKNARFDLACCHLSCDHIWYRGIRLQVSYNSFDLGTNSKDLFPSYHSRPERNLFACCSHNMGGHSSILV